MLKSLKESNLCELIHQKKDTSWFFLQNLQQILRNSLVVLELSVLKILHCNFFHSFDHLHFGPCFQKFIINLDRISQHNPYLIIWKLSQIFFHLSLLTIYLFISPEVHFRNLVIKSFSSKNESGHFKILITFRDFYCL